MKNIRPLVAAVIFFTPYFLSNLAVFIFLIPLLYLLYKGDPVHKGKLIAAFAAVTALVLLPVLTYDAGAYLVGVLLVTVFLSLFIIITGVLIRRLSGNMISVLVPPFVWILLIYLFDFRSLMSSAFDVGILFPVSAPLIWYLGSIGITVLLILFNALLAHFMVKKQKVSLLAVLLLSAVFLSSYVYSRNLPADEDAGTPRTVALIQGDVGDRDFFGYSDSLDDRIDRYIELSRKASKERPDMILWPEYSLPVDVMNTLPDKMASVTGHIERSGTDYVIGSMLTDPGNKGVRYNTALIFNENGELDDIYYSEEPAVFNRGITARVNENGLFLGNAGILLCWEEISEAVSRNYIEEGAGYLLALSSNAALDHSWLKGYISYFSRARAAENMRYLARVTQSGFTQLVDPVGRVVERLPAGREDFLVARIYPRSERTFYSRFGDILVRSFLLISFIVILTCLVRPVPAGGKKDR